MNRPLPPPPPYPPQSPLQMYPLPPPPPPPLPQTIPIPTTFALNEDQILAFKTWSSKFSNQQNGSVFTFAFTPTTCGTVVTVQHISGSQLDLSDF